jgi:PAB-dependent poly(A)-specific ribonuclease subunit 2
LEPNTLCISNHASDLFVGGNRLAILNLKRGKIVKEMEENTSLRPNLTTFSYTLLKKSRVLCAATTQGQIELRDLKSLNLIKSLDGHSGGILDLDAEGNMLVTCGHSIRTGSSISDPFVKCFDFRMMRSLAPLAFNQGPCCLKIHPKIPSLLLTCTQNGQFQSSWLDGRLESPQLSSIALPGFISCMALSSTGEFVAVGDQTGHLHVKYALEQSRVNNYAAPIEYLDSSQNFYQEKVKELKETDPLSLIGLPYYNEKLLSAWPSQLYFQIGKPTPKIPLEISQNMKRIDFVGYAPNPKTLKRNQILALSFTNQGSSTPKFRSQVQREKLLLGKHETPLSSQVSSSDVLHSLIPFYYQKVDIKYSKFGIEDFDFSFYNKTPFGGLENHLTNEYCNSLLQVLFFNKPLRHVCKAHLGVTCSLTVCLTCELGFLFKMLETAHGLNCQASNFLKSFSLIPQAHALGLLEPERPSEPIFYGKFVQKLNRFLLEQLSREEETSFQPEQKQQKQHQQIQQSSLQKAKQTTISKLFGHPMTSITTCQCGQEQTRDISPFVIDLIYVKSASFQVKY